MPADHLRPKRGFITHHRPSAGSGGALGSPCARRRRLTRRGALSSRAAWRRTRRRCWRSSTASSRSGCVPRHPSPSPLEFAAKPSSRLLGSTARSSVRSRVRPDAQAAKHDDCREPRRHVPGTAYGGITAAHHPSPSLAAAPRHFWGGNLEFTMFKAMPPYFCGSRADPLGSRHPCGTPSCWACTALLLASVPVLTNPRLTPTNPPPFPSFPVPNKRSWRRIARRSSSASAPSAR